jgi:myo-inositol-1(or 4)-monophosphatase
MKDLDLTQALNTARKAAQAGREVVLEYFGRLKKVQEKAQAGLVTEADLESEKVITAILKADFPDLPVLGEEGAFLSHDSHVEASSWVVDPLDGTTNYVHGFHIFNVSIGLQWRGDLVVGVVDVPLLGKTYAAARGRGAEVNGEKLAVSRRTTVRESLLATGFFPDDIAALKEQLKIFSELVFEARGDAFWEPNLKPWDAAAGTVLVREAGGVVWDYGGRDYRMGDRTLLAGNPTLARSLVERIQPLRGK